MTALKKKIKEPGEGGGFTLIELLIVIAILGVLAVVVLVAINPVQQLARTRDSGRMSTVAQLGRALQAYSATDPAGLYPVAATWDTLLTAVELDNIPGLITNSLNAVCTAATQIDGWCYDVDSTNENAIIYSRLEADASIEGLCDNATTGDNAYTLYDTSQGRGGVVCSAGDPVNGSIPFDFAN
ncbi:type II secretion system GspH family protein [Patescibacteria group bacterium]|nr:type II secretion system GspH family protein [Patescibacteria group bacterium]